MFTANELKNIHDETLESTTNRFMLFWLMPYIVERAKSSKSSWSTLIVNGAFSELTDWYKERDDYLRMLENDLVFFQKITELAINKLIKAGYKVELEIEHSGEGWAPSYISRRPLTSFKVEEYSWNTNDRCDLIVSWGDEDE